MNISDNLFPDDVVGFLVAQVLLPLFRPEEPVELMNSDAAESGIVESAVHNEELYVLLYYCGEVCILLPQSTVAAETGYVCAWYAALLP